LQHLPTGVKSVVSHGTDSLCKVKGSEPEQFIFVTLDLAQGAMKHTSDPMSEDELIALLGGKGMPKGEIISKIEQARKNPA
jgi:hypothetical protein